MKLEIFLQTSWGWWDNVSLDWNKALVIYLWMCTGPKQKTVLLSPNPWLPSNHGRDSRPTSWTNCQKLDVGPCARVWCIPLNIQRAHVTRPCGRGLQISLVLSWSKTATAPSLIFLFDDSTEELMCTVFWCALFGLNTWRTCVTFKDLE
jgi:hypothetical protein